MQPKLLDGRVESVNNRPLGDLTQAPQEHAKIVVHKAKGEDRL